MREITAKAGTELDLGKRGENLATRVTFDVTGWQTYGEGSFILLHKRNGDKTPYPCVVEVDNGKVFWNVTNTDTDIAGRGYAELQFIVGDVVVKSVTFNTKTTQSLGKAGANPPPPAAGWLEQMVELGVQAAENAAEAAEHAGTAEAASADAVEAAQNAADSEQNSELNANMARSYRMEAIQARNAAQNSATAAQNSAQEAVENALQATEIAINATKQELSDYVSAAENAQDAALAAQEAAEAARDQAQEVVGGDFVLSSEKGEPNGVAVLDEEGKIPDEHLPELDYVPASHTEEENPHNVTLEMIGAAPSGFGLGAAPPVIDDVDKAVFPGWYVCNGSTINTPDKITLGQYGSVFVQTNRNGNVMQRYVSKNTYLPSFVEAIRWNVTGEGWQPWEYINPSMELGVEYRTTERYLGKPEYRKLVDCGALPNATTKDVEHGITNISFIAVDTSCSFIGYLSSASTNALPIYPYITELYPTINSENKRVIRITTSADMSGRIGRIMLKYTKTTD